jgi:PAS domain S-box-containing protein
MTSPITTRKLKIYRISGSVPIEEIINSRKPRYAFTSGTLTYIEAAEKAGFEFETIFANSHADAYPLLESGEIDGYIALDTAEAAFDAHSCVVSNDFFPLVFRSSGLTTQTAELEPIISVMDKALNGQTISYLVELRKAGYQKYLRNKLHTFLTEEERSYIKNNPVVPIAAEFNNYPVSFFDTYTNQWEGIYFDALKEIANMTGLAFECVNTPDVQYPELIAALESGKALILSELSHMKEYENRFLWSEVPLLYDNYAFITRSDFRDIETSDIPYLHVGGRKDTPYVELFTSMFPEHKNFTTYDTQEGVWEALKHGDIDVIFSCRRRLVIYTNYYEDAGYKLNLIFNNTFGTFLGFNKDTAILRSIIDKALLLININNISAQWMNKTYDYRHKLIESQRPWLFGSSVMLVLFLAVVTFFLIKGRRTGKVLEKLVKQRTKELERETTTLRAIFNSSPDYIFCKDLNSRYTRCNRIMEQTFGISEEGIIGKDDREAFLFSEQTAEEFIEQDKKVLAEKEHIVFVNQMVPLSDRNRIEFIETIKTPLIQNGEVVGIMGISRDITARKTLEKELEYQTSLLKTIITSLPDAVFCKDLDFKYTVCNNYMAELFGRQVEDMLGRNNIGALGMSEGVAIISYEADLKVIKEQRRVVFEESLLCADGVTRLFETIKSPLITDGKVIGIVGIARDISQRKAMEKALSLQTSKLQAMIASIPEIMFCKDTDFRYTQCNKFFEESNNVSEADVLGKTDAEAKIFDPEDVERINKAEWIVINENRVIMLEERILVPSSGKERFFETVKAPLRQDGVVVGLIAIIRDITQRKAMENELEFQTSKLKTMIDSIPDLMFCKDVNYKYTQCDKYFEQFMGVTEADILEKSNRDGTWFHLEDAEKIHDVERAVIKENRIITVEERIHSPFTGKECVFETVKAPLKQEGVVVGLIAIIRDITQRKVMENELAYQTSLLKTIIGTIPEAVFCKDLDFKYTLCNNYMLELFQKKEEDIIGKDDISGLGLFGKTAAVASNTDQKVMNEHQIVTYEEWVHSADGEDRLFETIKSPLIIDEKIIGALGIGRDITQRKIMEEELKATSLAKSSFLANMSHELRTPLNVVIGLTDLLLEDSDLTEHITTNLVKISNAGNTLLSIVNDVLDFSKIESGKLELVPVEYYTSSLINDVITLVITRLGEKPIIFRIDINDDFPDKLFGDDLRVKQIFTNLLSNAIKYTRQGSIELTVRCTRESDYVWMDITVKDTGIGIREKDLKKLFSDYNQVDTRANRNIEGTGLGLAITKRLAEMMDGEIHVESKFGKGSIFNLRLKQGFISNVSIGAETADKLRNFCYIDDKRIVTQKLVRLNLSYARVLVVDDMQTNMDVASGLLGSYKIKVDCVDHGQAAIDRIREGTPVYNAIFMDHMMPGMDGVEAADAIRALGTEYAQKIPIIALTANAIHGTEKMFLEHGFQAFISKPIDVMELDSVLRKWVRDENREEVPVIDDHSTFEAKHKNIVTEIQGVDIKKGLSLYGGEMKIYLPLLRSYAANTPGILDKLRTVSQETLSDYVITVHGLKGTSAGIGVEGIRKEAAELEERARDGDLQSVLAKNDKLIADTEIVLDKLKEWLKQNDVNVKPVLKAPDKELLIKLRHSCETYDMDGIDQAMSELEKANYEEDAELIAWLRNKIDISKIGEIKERLINYK